VGTLYIVATPIGNLEDITFRAIRILKECDLIACEDTRHTRKLLNHFGIETPTTSYFEHNKFAKGNQLIRQLQEGKSVALVSDAGTPGVSDPGYNLVVEAVQKGIAVVPVPGPSAAVSALCASGLPTDRFLFIGFLPQKDGKKRKVLESLVDQPSTLIFYESPFRVTKTLRLIGEAFGDSRRAVLAHELTKVHEGFFRGTIAELLERESELIEKGEWIVMVEGAGDT
jgi:16S rRNA (cytidine1402-2'-O)-methyltransferase